MDIVIWGAGYEGNQFFSMLDTKKVNIIAVVDSNPSKWGERAFNTNIQISNPETICKLSYDYIYICTSYYVEVLNDVKRLLKNSQLAEEKCVIATKAKAKDNYAFLLNESGMIQATTDSLKSEWDIYIKQNYWRNICMDTINGVSWLQNISLSLGRWAVGYEYIYILVRILTACRPKSILEMGLGQSTKILSRYCDYFEGTAAEIVEQDENWINFWMDENVKSDRLNINYSELAVSHGEIYDCYEYKDFERIVRNTKFDLISIDGPWGSERMSRHDILLYIPLCLPESFVIIIDDAERIGEKETIKAIIDKMEKNGIAYGYSVYSGEKDVCVITSEDYKFLLSM